MHGKLFTDNRVLLLLADFALHKLKTSAAQTYRSRAPGTGFSAAALDSSLELKHKTQTTGASVKPFLNNWAKRAFSHIGMPQASFNTSNCIRYQCSFNHFRSDQSSNTMYHSALLLQQLNATMQQSGIETPIIPNNRQPFVFHRLQTPWCTTPATTPCD